MLLEESFESIDLDEVEWLLDIANRDADNLLRQVVETNAGVFTRDQLTYLAQEQLKQMDYEVQITTDDVVTATEARQIVGRQGDKEFRVIIYPNGTLWYDAVRGYDGQECGEAVETFLKGLEDVGVEGLWEPVYSLDQMRQQFHHMLRQEGYIFQETPSDGGLIITAKQHDKEFSTFVRWDGSTENTPELAQKLPESYLTRMKKQAETHRAKERMVIRVREL